MVGQRVMTLGLVQDEHWQNIRYNTARHHLDLVKEHIASSEMFRRPCMTISAYYLACGRLTNFLVILLSNLPGVAVTPTLSIPMSIIYRMPEFSASMLHFEASCSSMVRLCPS